MNVRNPWNFKIRVGFIRGQWNEIADDIKHLAQRDVFIIVPCLADDMASINSVGGDIALQAPCGGGPVMAYRMNSGEELSTFLQDVHEVIPVQCLVRGLSGVISDIVRNGTEYIFGGSVSTPFFTTDSMHVFDAERPNG